MSRINLANPARASSVIIWPFISVLVFGFTLLSTANFVHADTITIYPTEDTYIDSENPNSNYVGSYAFFADKAIYNSDLFPDEERIGLLKFDLSNKIPAGSTVNSATLRLTLFEYFSATPYIGVYKYSNNNWNPMTATWNNFPGGTYQYLSDVAIPYKGQYYYWNVLSALNGEILSLAVKSTRTEEGWEVVAFWSVNYDAQADRPVLIIDYTPPPYCVYEIGATSAVYEASGGIDSVSLAVTHSDCTWTAVSNASWITLTGNISGTGDGTVTYSVDENLGATRQGTITVAGQTITIKQKPGKAVLPWMPLLLEE